MPTTDPTTAAQDQEVLTFVSSRGRCAGIFHNSEWFFPADTITKLAGLAHAVTYRDANAAGKTALLPRPGHARMCVCVAESFLRAILEDSRLPRIDVRDVRASIRWEMCPPWQEPVDTSAVAPAAPPPDSTVARPGSPAVEQIVEIKLRSMLAEFAPRRREIPQSVRTEHTRTVRHQHGLCPCCLQAKIVVNGQVVGGEYDHYFSSSQPDAAHSWLVCSACHRELTEGRLDRDEVSCIFQAYQYRRRRLAGEQLALTEAAQ